MDGEIYRLLKREPLNIEVPNFTHDHILITGGDGFLGHKVAGIATYAGAKVTSLDIDDCDVTDMVALENVFLEVQPSIVIHLAAHKYATSAEDAPAQVTELNVIGTQNVVHMCGKYHYYKPAKLVLASTCKAADPCTVYGASKLIAERIALNFEKGSAFRLVNVIGSTGSVIDIWDSLAPSDPLPVTPGERYWIAPDEAARYLLACANMKPGLYGPHGMYKESVKLIANRYDPDRPQQHCDNRRGDRPVERLLGEYDAAIQHVGNNMIEIKRPW